MARYKILPTDQSYSSAEINALDPSSVLHVVQRLNCKEADVLHDGVYSFSVRLADGGMWSIFQRPDHRQAPIGLHDDISIAG